MIYWGQISDSYCAFVICAHKKIHIFYLVLFITTKRFQTANYCTFLQRECVWHLNSVFIGEWCCRANQKWAQGAINFEHPKVTGEQWHGHYSSSPWPFALLVRELYLYLDFRKAAFWWRLLFKSSISIKWNWIEMNLRSYRIFWRTKHFWNLLTI